MPYFFCWAFHPKPRCTFSLDRKSTQKDQARLKSPSLDTSWWDLLYNRLKPPVITGAPISAHIARLLCVWIVSFSASTSLAFVLLLFYFVACIWRVYVSCYTIRESFLFFADLTKMQTVDILILWKNPENHSFLVFVSLCFYEEDFLVVFRLKKAIFRSLSLLCRFSKRYIHCKIWSSSFLMSWRITHLSLS